MSFMDPIMKEQRGNLSFFQEALKVSQHLFNDMARGQEESPATGTRRLSSVSAYGDRLETKNPFVGVRKVSSLDVVEVVMGVVDRALENQGLKKAPGKKTPQDFAPNEFDTEKLVWMAKKNKKDEGPVIGNLAVTARVQKGALRTAFAAAQKSLPRLVAAVMTERAHKKTAFPAGRQSAT